MSHRLFVTCCFWCVLLSGCGGGSSERSEDPTFEATPVYYQSAQSTTQIIDSPQIELAFARVSEGVSSKTVSELPLCEQAAIEVKERETHAAVIRFIKFDQSITEETIDKHVIYETQVAVPHGCLFYWQDDAIALDEGVGYAWEIYEADTEVKNRKWHNVVYMEAEAVSSITDDPLQCDENLVADSSFYSPKTHWIHGQSVSSSTVTLTQIAAAGHDDNYAAMLSSPFNVIYQTLDTPIVVSNHYQLELSIKVPEASHAMQLKAVGFNGTLPDGLAPSADAAVIGVSGILPMFEHWYRVTLDVWSAPQSFDRLAIAIINEENRPISALIDRVCLRRAEANPCLDDVESIQDFMGVSDDFDLEAQSPTITQVEYLAGSVEDLYHDEDVSTINWYAEPSANTVLGCAIDNETDEETEADDATLAEYELEDADSDLLITELEAYDAVLADSDTNALKQTDFLTVQPINNEKCSDAIRDPSRPFSGRDIVYVHGLQMAALKDNALPPVQQKFQGKWPADSAAFEPGGAFYEEAAHYWSEHITRGLGGTTSATASNSFLIASWSANQRVPYAINALMTQIRDAMAGENTAVVMSKTAKENEQCFGDNGIVVVTHSTGGLIASVLFGMGERSHTDVAINERFGDFRFITDKIDAQVGINSAYGGSPLAKVALALLTEFALSIPAQVVANDLASEYLTFAPNPQVANLSVWYNSMLFDLVPEISANQWRPYMQSTIPTLTSIGAIAGKTIESEGGFGTTRALIKGFDDGVLSPSSQANNVVRRPRFQVQKKRLLKDKGVPRKKRLRMVADGKKSSGLGARNYFVSPYLAPSGMLQHQSVDALIDAPNQHVANHHSVIQNTGDHFDNVNMVDRNGNDYGRVKDNARNYEESSVVFNSALYSTGLLHSDFASLTQEWVRKETWGLHLPGIRWVDVGIFGLKVPVPYWKYYEWVKWKRHYHLLEGHENKLAMDYMYEHVLR